MADDRLGGNAIIVSAPSGAGKTTLISWVVSKEAGRMVFSVSATTRAPRDGERDGDDYIFWRREKFLEARKNGELLEWAEVHGHLYGTPKTPALTALSRGLDVVFDVDVQGARNLMGCFPGAVSVFILPPSAPELRRRLIARGTESPPRLEARLADAFTEIMCYHEFDFLVVNDDLDEARVRLREIVRASRARRARVAPRAAAIAATFETRR